MTHGSTLWRVLVADHHCCVREGLKAIIGSQSDLRVVGEAGDGPTAPALASDLNPRPGNRVDIPAGSGRRSADGSAGRS